jgi:hypothetical protein
MKKKYSVDITKDGTTNVHTLNIDNDFTLFRYRPANEYTLDALVKSDFWVSRPDSFNDPYDTSFVVDSKKLIDHLLENTDEELIYTYANLRNIKSKSKKSIANKWIEDLYKENMSFFKKLFLVSCFSEDVSNEVMWAHYADNGKGFVIEYHYKDLLEIKNSHCKLVNDLTDHFVQQIEGYKEIYGDVDTKDTSQYNTYRIIYTNDKYDATEIIKTSIDVMTSMINIEGATYLDVLKEYRAKGINIFDPKKQKTISDSIVFTKKKIWNYEKEWRLLLPNLLVDVTKAERQHYNVGKLMPKAIYLGEYVNLSTKINVYNYCYTNGVKLYQMFSKMKKKSYGLSYYEISKTEMIQFLDKVE